MAKRLNMRVVVVFMDVDYMKWVMTSILYYQKGHFVGRSTNILRSVFRSTDVI